MKTCNYDGCQRCVRPCARRRMLPDRFFRQFRFEPRTINYVINVNLCYQCEIWWNMFVINPKCEKIFGTTRGVLFEAALTFLPPTFIACDPVTSAAAKTAYNLILLIILQLILNFFNYNNTYFLKSNYFLQLNVQRVWLLKIKYYVIN